jgi:hypothetical protein
MDVAIGRHAECPDLDLAIDRHDLQRTLVLELYRVLADHVAAAIDGVADLRWIGQVGCKRSPARRQKDGRRGSERSISNGPPGAKGQSWRMRSDDAIRPQLLDSCGFVAEFPQDLVGMLAKLGRPVADGERACAKASPAPATPAPVGRARKLHAWKNPASRTCGSSRVCCGVVDRAGRDAIGLQQLERLGDGARIAPLLHDRRERLAIVAARQVVLEARVAARSSLPIRRHQRTNSGWPMVMRRSSRPCT